MDKQHLRGVAWELSPTTVLWRLSPDLWRRWITFIFHWNKNRGTGRDVVVGKGGGTNNAGNWIITDIVGDTANIERKSSFCARINFNALSPPVPDAPWPTNTVRE